jgi:uncharacterized iron-regulated membrane protein
MNKRNYNVLFHTHTVSGITISVILYIIFFAGAFALFKDEITAWEKGSSLQLEQAKNLDIDRLIKSIEDNDHELYGRDIRIRYPDPKQEITVSLLASQDTSVVEEARQFDFFNIHALDYTKSEYYDFYSFGELIYRLHFFNQIPVVGIYIAGFTAMFLLFAIITGILIHWKKIVTNFYQFRPTKKWKTIWTDAHTALGVIGLPFQIVYAITSAFLCLSIFVLLPANFFVDGDRDRLINEILPANKTYELSERSTEKMPPLNDYLFKALNEWEDFIPAMIWVRNYGASNMKLQIEGSLHSSKSFVSTGRIIYDVYSGEEIEKINPHAPNFTENFYSLTQRLHYANFGGLLLKIVYFLMALVTCFVIISGVLIWLEARDKKNISDKQRRFNKNVGYYYVSICMTMFPVTALTLFISKCLGQGELRKTILYAVFFGCWSIMSTYFIRKKDNYLTNRATLLLGGCISLLIPVVNGVITRNWFWNNLLSKQYELLVVDMIWICLGIIALATCSSMKQRADATPLKIA